MRDPTEGLRGSDAERGHRPLGGLGDLAMPAISNLREPQDHAGGTESVAKFARSRLPSGAKQLKFSDFRSLRGTQDIEAHSGDGTGGETIDSLMADRASGD